MEKKIKKLLFINSKKGGVGKSSFAYNLALYYREKDYFGKVGFFDADAGLVNPSSMQQLSGIVPKDQLHELFFTGSDGNFSKEAIDSFIEKFGNSAKRDIAVVDLGSKTSDNLVDYLKDTECLSTLNELLKYYGIRPVFLCLFAGNMCDRTAPEIEDVFETIKPLDCEKIIVNNKFFSRNEEVESGVLQFLEKKYGAKTVDFQFISNSTSKDVMGKITALINHGVNIHQEKIELLSIPAAVETAELIRITNVNTIIKDFWNTQIATRFRINKNFDSFRNQLDQVL